jgi:hypothetical protein
MPSPFFRLVLCARVGVDAAGLGHRWMLCGYTNLLLKNNTVEWLTRVNSRCGLVLVVWACVIAQRSQALPRLWGSEHQPSGSEVSMGGGHWTDGRAFSVPFHAVAARLCASCGGSATLQGDWRHLPARYHCLYGYGRTSWSAIQHAASFPVIDYSLLPIPERTTLWHVCKLNFFNFD